MVGCDAPIGAGGSVAQNSATGTLRSRGYFLCKALDCPERPTYREAEEVCGSRSMRLCRLEEVVSGRGDDGRCGYQSKASLLWTSNICGQGNAAVAIPAGTSVVDVSSRSSCMSMDLRAGGVSCCPVDNDAGAPQGQFTRVQVMHAAANMTSEIRVKVRNAIIEDAPVSEGLVVAYKRTSPYLDFFEQDQAFFLDVYSIDAEKSILLATTQIPILLGFGTYITCVIYGYDAVVLTCLRDGLPQRSGSGVAFTNLGDTAATFQIIRNQLVELSQAVLPKSQSVAMVQPGTCVLSWASTQAPGSKVKATSEAVNIEQRQAYR